MLLGALVTIAVLSLLLMRDTSRRHEAKKP